MRGVTFNQYMALAVNELVKTVTRRLVKGVPDAAATLEQVGPTAFVAVGSNGKRANDTNFTPPYWVGDLVYVKEPYTVAAAYDHLPPSQLPKGITVHYLADGLESEDRGRYRHARFMPQALSRTTLRVKDVRGERLNLLTPQEAIKEGFAPYIVAEMLKPITVKVTPADVYYVVFDDNSHEPSGEMCRECVEKFAAAHPGGQLYGSANTFECDGFPGCVDCGRLLNMTYSDSAIESELDNWGQFPNSLGAESLYVIRDMIDWCFPQAYEPGSVDAVAYDGNVGKLDQCSFVWLWNRLHPATPFHLNPMVWRIEFEAVQ